MRKITLFLTVLAFSALTFGQVERCIDRSKAGEMVNLAQQNDFKSLKAYGDTFMLEDFAGGFPAGWQSVDNTGNGFDFIWSDVGPTGAWTGTWPNPASAISSASAANGFMMLPSDYYNTDAGGSMVANPIDMDCYLQTSAFDFTGYPSVLVRLSAEYRTCCASASAIWMKVSTDGINWSDAYDIKTNPNNVWTYTEPEFNISDIAGNQATVYFRFGQESSSHYFFELDDIAFVEGPANDIVYEKSFIYKSDFSGFYNYIPYEMIHHDSVFFAAAVFNNGSNAIQHPELKVEASIDGYKYWENTSSVSQSALTSGTVIDSINPLAKDTLSLAFNGDGAPVSFLGDFYFGYEVTHDSLDQNPDGDNSSRSFEIVEAVYARDNGDTLDVTSNGDTITLNDNVSWQMWSGGGVDGDRLGVTYDIGRASEIRYMSFFCHPETDPGVSVVGYLLKYNSGTGEYDPILNSQEYIISAADTATWVELYYQLDGTSEFVDEGYYMAVLEVYYQGLEFWIGEDQETDQVGYATRWWEPTDPTYYWYTNYSYTPMIRLHTLNFIINTTPTFEIDQNMTYTYDISTINSNGVPSLSAPTLPAWLTLTDNGDGTAVLTGVAGAGGDYPVVINATDADTTIAQDFIITVIGSGELAIVQNPPSPVEVGELFEYTPQASGGTGTYEWSILAMPTWVSWDATNLQLSGTPDSTAVGEANEVVLEVTDGVDSVQWNFQISVTSTGIDELENNISISPNPTNGLLHINNVANANVRVMNILGEQVASITRTELFNTLNLNGLAKGTYIVKIYKDNSSITRKIHLQ